MHRESIGPSSDQVTRIAFEPQVAVMRAAQRQALHLAAVQRVLAGPSLRALVAAPALAMVVGPAQICWAQLD